MNERHRLYILTKQKKVGQANLECVHIPQISTVSEAHIGEQGSASLSKLKKHKAVFFVRYQPTVVFIHPDKNFAVIDFYTRLNKEGFNDIKAKVVRYTRMLKTAMQVVPYSCRLKAD